jgi:potassium-dependent mechanosensitive channel
MIFLARVAKLFLVVVLSSWLAVPSARAQAAAPEERLRLDAIREAVSQARRALVADGSDFTVLTRVRAELGVPRDEARMLLVASRARVDAARARLRDIEPLVGSLDRPDIALERRGLERALAEFEAVGRDIQAVSTLADQTYDDLTDRRRKLFSTRIFDFTDSILSPMFWLDVVGNAIPDLTGRFGGKLGEIAAGIEQRRGGPILLGVAAFMMAVIVGLWLAHRWLGARRRSLAVEADPNPSKSAIATRALSVVAMRAIPFATAALALGFAVTRFDLVPGDVQLFMVGLSNALFMYGLGIGAAQAVFAPKAPGYRLAKTDDATAREAVRVLDVLLTIYLAGMIVHGLEQMLSARVALTIATTALLSLLLVVVAGVMLARAYRRVEPGDPVGAVPLPLHLVRPLGWGLALVIVGALLFGYIALAGFVAGRAIATLVILCLALVAYIAIEALFEDALARGHGTNDRLSRLLGLPERTIELVGTIGAGVARVALLLLTFLVLFSPWGIEFGNTNPFEDAFFGVRFGDLRGWLGAAGIAIVLFGTGLFFTRLFVAWLDRRLLPRTEFDTGVRHSISTIAGYVGFALALFIALSQAGVELQNIALVAGALSVGIGFGLQQVVSNFVAGLIVLAERPIRVGDTVVVKGEEGKVKRISVRSTELSLGERSSLIVPNADFISSIVRNRSLNDFTQRVKIVLVLAHDADVEAAIRILMAAALLHPNRVASAEPTVFIDKVTENGIVVELKFVCDHLDNMDIARTEVIATALTGFRGAGIALATSS